MTDDSVEQAALATGGAGERLAPPSLVRDRRFNIALVIAGLAHALLLTGAGRSHPRIVGDEKGSPDTIDVSLVTEDDLKERSPAPKSADLPPAALKPALSDVTPPPAEQRPPEQVEKPAEPETAAPPPEVKDIPDPFSFDTQVQPEPKKPPQKAPPKKPQPEKTEAKKTAKLDLSPPGLDATSLSGKSAAFQRPPGITRSGENDEFARRVIAALRQTMPQLSAVRGRGTIRILLDNNGNVIDVKLIATSRIADIDQGIVFAARQTSYPFPPRGANEADRTFVVTYIYN